MLSYILGYMGFISVLSWLIMGIDKRNARKRRQRISEKQLWFLTIIGGSAGTLLSMYMFRHKTKHTPFIVGVPFVLLIHVALLLFILFGLSDKFFDWTFPV
ncbi:uncharacterized membrane protein YsdA (DUF1294 family) [Salibacterium salarium]|nr:uncharacterized membrane protein YsdA (DUF1294 family) [Salibacterium salarium]